jgi:hypothetical protein
MFRAMAIGEEFTLLDAICEARERGLSLEEFIAEAVRERDRSESLG